MKALAMILTLILAQQTLASSCFDTQAVKDLIEASEESNECFSKDVLISHIVQPGELRALDEVA